MNFMKKTSISLILLLIICLGCNAQSKMTADQVLDKAIAAVTNSKGLTVDFAFSGGNQAGKGNIKSTGNKFTVTMPQAEIWYNGKDLYTYNKKTKETTLMTPTMQELAESNPLLYVKGAKGSYTASFSTEKKAGRYVIDLLPKKKNSDMKKITLVLRANDYLPEKITVTPRSGGPVSIAVSQIKTGIVLAASIFEYPRSKYPKVEIIDLR